MLTSKCLHTSKLRMCWSFSSAVRCLSCALRCRGLAAGIYTTNSPEACQYVATNCEADVLVVENKKQLDKILQVRSFTAAVVLRKLEGFNASLPTG